MLTIRLRRQGAKKNAKYRIVVAESARAREGSFIEVIGHYNPRATPEQFVVDRERLAHWLGEGAQASNTVRTLVSRHRGDATAAVAEVEQTAS
jgi:small subunit ribosomal protein S16